MERLLAEQEDVLYQIARTVDNFKKLGQGNFTTSVTRNRMSILEKQWTQCQKLHADLKAAVKPAERDEWPYFSEEQFRKATEDYYEASDYLSEVLERLTRPTAHVTASSTLDLSSGPPSSILLPRIELPKFSGQYTEWVNFRDIFESIVIKNEGLTNVQRLHYLKSSLTSEARIVIKNISVTDANYELVWGAVKERYENTRAIVSSYLNTILEATPKADSVSELKRVHDSINDAVLALRNLERNCVDDFVVAILSRKLDVNTRTEWEISLGNKREPASFNELSTFLVGRMLALNVAGDTRSSNNSKTNRSAATKSLTAAISNVKCLYCAGSHLLFQCAQFKSLSTEQRKNVARQHRCCYNCLTKGHYPRDCKSRGRCARCQRKHHTLLHDDNISGGQTTMGAPAIASTSSVNTVNDAPSKSSLLARVTTPSRSLLVKGTVLLATARIFVRTDGARCINLRGMIDTGAEATFITERAVQALKAKRIKVYYTVTGMGDLQAGVVTHAVKLHLSAGIQSSTTVTVIAFILPVLTSYAPRSPVDLLAHPHLQNLKFADSDPFSDDPIDLLIGLDYYKAVTMDGSRRGPSSDLMAKPTIFGWVVFGPCNDTSEGNPQSVSSLRCSISPETDALMRQFWEIEEVSVSNPLTEEEVECERHFASTHSRLPSGRYQVRLPFRTDFLNKVGRSFHVASGAFDRLERRLARDSALSASYRGFLSEYEQMGHMTRVNPNEVINNNSLYLSHHPVVKASSSTSPVRVVFNASSPMDNGYSLNDLLLTGPKLQSDLCSIIMRWRTHRFVFVADVAKMFRQIMIHPLDTDFQRILWRPSSGQPIHHYRLITVTYGTASAPYLSMRVLRQLCEDEGSAFPLAVTILNNSIYVDDVLFGADSVSAIQSTRQQLNALLLKGGFHLRKWTSNYDELLSEIPVSDRLEDNSVEFDEDSSFKVLGISWSPILDRFHFRIQIPEFSVISKRSVLSAISRFFDPLGWIAPVVITAKIFMQELWLRKVDWDSPLSSDLEE
ncbi:uncharacterized protein LOC120357294 [Solenopsis invicta]|uniref:uncharacterized protein LOC120357294 n=1 Tax=Solenopsis invicta TaxID=13686 RepID=UPI00193E2EE0|nr:uncharacterized protein LOC120357294 [Solenopsis invicta]